MKRTTYYLAYLAFIMIFPQKISSQLYSNGSISTTATSISGIAAPFGYVWSELQNNTGNTTQVNGTAGLPAYFKTDGSISYRLADDFVVPAGQQWNVTSFDFYVYQSSYTGVTPPIDQLRVQIYNTNPSIVGAIPIAGNMTANVYDLANSDNPFIYRIFNSSYPAPGQVTNTTRKIWKVRGNITAILPPGNYWVEYQAHPTDNTNVFFPPVTIVGTRGLAAWNSKINVIASTFGSDVLGWGINSDIGIPNSAPDVTLDLPFNVNGTITTLAIDQNNIDNNIVITPNPVKSNFTITIPENLAITSIEIYDINARKMKQVEINNITNINVNVQELSQGIYFLKIISDKGILSKKFIKQ